MLMFVLEIDGLYLYYATPTGELIVVHERVIYHIDNPFPIIFTYIEVY